MGFLKNPFLDSQEDLERQQTSPRAPLMAAGSYHVDPPGQHLVIFLVREHLGHGPDLEPTLPQVGYGTG